MLLLLPNLSMGASPVDAEEAAVSASPAMRNTRVMSFGRGAFSCLWMVLPWS